MPRTETIEKTYFQFDELDDDAKKTARQWWRDGALDYDWWDSVYDDFTTILEILGYSVSPRDIQFSGFWSQGDGASFTGSYGYAKQSRRKIREYAPNDEELHRIADDLSAMQKRNFFQVTGSISRSHWRYVHEGTMSCDVEREDACDWDYESALDTFRECSRDLAHWLYRQLEEEYDYRMSDESVDENIRINEYEFDESGQIQ